jgi:hypothetical protein
MTRLSGVDRLDRAFKADALPRRFYFDRSEDVTGVSGAGIVAYGVEFHDGTVALRWCSKLRSTTVYSSMDDVRGIHGHDGRTKVVWLDQASEGAGPDSPGPTSSDNAQSDSAHECGGYCHLDRALWPE